MRLRLMLLAVMLLGSLLGSRPALAQGPKACRFVHESPPVGQEVFQNVHFVLVMIVEKTDSDQNSETSEEGIERRQQRRLTVLESSAGRTTEVRVTYLSAEQTRAEQGEVGPTVAQPVAGKTYFVARVDGELVVTDRSGQTPPPAELAIVQQNMIGVGQPNPLARFLNGRMFEVGQTVAFPDSLAQDLLGMRGTLGEVQRVDMTLREIRRKAGRRLATFTARIEARPVSGAGVGMEIEGKLVVDIDTCRTVAASFAGPVTLLETEGPPDARQTE